ncbi:MAG TPA: HlyD family efflux transporter periplasmic adaptor subunit [Deltaproteobacteria bacterium]|nr:HlyD family efflux transporter periplasmic adaptor subunit [Deltaproteobacteria bacterium]
MFTTPERRSLALAAILAAAFFITTASLADTGSSEHDESHTSGDAHDEQDIVSLDESVMREFGIEIGVAGPGLVTRSVTLPAEIRPNEDRLAHIAPRFPGIAREVRKKVGDTVRAGETLAIIESSESLAPYPLKTLIDGIVIERHITRGEPVSQQRGRVFTVADLSTVWVDISIYQKHLDAVKLGQTVMLSAGHGKPGATGTISYISPIIDEDTRTATARIVLDNPDGRWRPGLFVTARVEVDHVRVPVAVPRSALEQIDDSTVIFVEAETGFVPRPVMTGREGGDLVEIEDGLVAGERYVRSGGFTLKSELAREELSGGHSH